MATKQDDHYSKQEPRQRLQKILQGAFAGPPTPLKDIPTTEGKLRRIGGKPQRRRVAQQKRKRAF